MNLYLAYTKPVWKTEEKIYNYNYFNLKKKGVLILKRQENSNEEKFKFMTIIGKFTVEKAIKMIYINIIYK